MAASAVPISLASSCDPAVSSSTVRVAPFRWEYTNVVRFSCRTVPATVGIRKGSSARIAGAKARSTRNSVSAAHAPVTIASVLPRLRRWRSTRARGVPAASRSAASYVPSVGGWMPPFGYRPLLTLVVLLETVGFILFGFGFMAELIATLRAEVEDLLRRGR